MKTLFIESIEKNPIQLSTSEIKKLPKKLFLVYSIQYKKSALKIRSQLESEKIKLIGFQQVLGCSKLNLKDPVFLIGTGRFHALNLYLQSPEVYLLEGNKIIKIPQKDIEKLKQKRKTALIKFHSSEKIGILVSTKPGQENLKQAIKLKKSLIKKGKKPYIFISNNIDINQFENFQIGCWVNTACAGLAYDNSNIINISEISLR